MEDLARAEVEEVLALWSGLGYYRRARQLHAAARRVVEIGGFPRTVEGLRELPGIGPYTAAAVASIAFGVAEPVLDGNVERVLSRWLALELDPKSRPARERMLAAAAGLLDPERAGDSNQALMELGATVCVPKRPRCLLCPIAPGCQAVSGGNDPERFREASSAGAGAQPRLLVAVVERGRRRSAPLPPGGGPCPSGRHLGAALDGSRPIPRKAWLSVTAAAGPSDPVGESATPSPIASSSWMFTGLKLWPGGNVGLVRGAGAG